MDLVEVIPSLLVVSAPVVWHSFVLPCPPSSLPHLSFLFLFRGSHCCSLALAKSSFESEDIESRELSDLDVGLHFVFITINTNATNTELLYSLLVQMNKRLLSVGLKLFLPNILLLASSFLVCFLSFFSLFLLFFLSYLFFFFFLFPFPFQQEVRASRELHQREEKRKRKARRKEKRKRKAKRKTRKTKARKKRKPKKTNNKITNCTESNPFTFHLLFFFLVFFLQIIHFFTHIIN